MHISPRHILKPGYMGFRLTYLHLTLTYSKGQGQGYTSIVVEILLKLVQGEPRYKRNCEILLLL